MMVRDEFDCWMREQVSAVETALQASIPVAGPARLTEAMRYAALGGGKRMRALLALASCRAVDGDESLAMDSAVALELIHAYSLVHDDLPCMDNDELRRGKPTVHVRYGEAVGVLVGDALQALAFEGLAKGSSPERRLRLCALLAQAAGSVGMVGGQVIDILNVGRQMGEAALADMHRRKTGALLRAAVMMGVASGDADRTLAAGAAFADFGELIGLAFQVADDVIDATSTNQQLGKTAGKDLAQGKPTYVTLLGLGAARERAVHLCQQAHNALMDVPQEKAGPLHMLADMVVHRVH